MADRLYRRRAIINNPELLRRAAHLAIDLDCPRHEVIEDALHRGLTALERKQWGDSNAKVDDKAMLPDPGVGPPSITRLTGNEEEQQRGER